MVPSLDGERPSMLLLMVVRWLSVGPAVPGSCMSVISEGSEVADMLITVVFAVLLFYMRKTDIVFWL